MFCPNCGSKIPDDSKFCGSCGANLSDVMLEPEAEENQKVPADAGFAPVAPAPVAVDPDPGIVQFRKKSNKNKIIGIVAVVAAVAVVIAILFGLKSLFSGGSDNAYVYVSDGKYELLTNLKKDKYIEIASGKNDSVNSNLLSFSPDGKYIYYYTKYDSSTGTGSLCRAEYGKLKENASKNDKYIEIIATNVMVVDPFHPNFCFLDDSSLIYKNGSGTLYHYDGKEPAQIAKNVRSYYTDGADRVAYETANSEGNALYGVKLSDIDNKIKLASNFSYIHNAADLNNILYTKQEDDNSETLYVVGFEKDSEKLGENVGLFSTVDGKTYFTEENGTSLNLYDYVVDDYADADSGITEPNADDFIVPQYRYDMVYGSNLSENDFEELYTSCTRDLYWYGQSSWSSYSMEDALKRDWGDRNDGIHAATQNFMDKFAGSADENGYILVTDEVKAALKEIQRYADHPEEEWQWMWLCYNKRESGTTTDYDAYNAASDKWREAGNRIEMRETLQKKENEYPVCTLYCFENGKLTTINENVLSTRGFNGAIMFNTSELIADTVDIKNVSSISSVTQLFNIDYEAQNYIVSTSTSTTYQMSASAAETYAEALGEYGASLFFADDKVYMGSNENDAPLSVASIANGQIDDFTILTDDAIVNRVDGSIVYYISEYYENNGIFYCDLYSCNGKESKRLARDVVLGNTITNVYGFTNLYDDGVILAYTGYRNGSGYELTLFDSDGEKTIIGDNIFQYIRVDKSTLLYISDGDLYLYNGKDKRLVHNDVQCLWSLNAMDIKHSFGYYDYMYN